MGKKTEKVQFKECQEISEDEKENKPLEPYVCTGNFQADFTELCRRNDMYIIPPVILKPKLPKERHIHEGKTERKGRDKKDPQFDPDAENLNEDGTPIEPPPKTYVIKDAFEYFKPTVQVEMEHQDKQDMVTEVFIKGWKIDEPMMNVFKQCWPVLEKLHQINLWNVGLTGETVSILAEFLPRCLNVKNVILDGNNVKEENWHELMGEKSPIQNLSLRNCNISDKGADGIGKAIGRATKNSSNLISLNLAGNRITDIGCEQIAKGLNMNRTLLTLSLAYNQIGDRGCCKLAESVSRFPLTHEEVVERRKQMSDKISPVPIKSHVNIQVRHKEKSKKISGKQKKDGKGDDKSRKDEKGVKKDSRLNRENTLGSSLGKSKVPKGSSATLVGTESRPLSGKSKDRKRDKKMYKDNEMEMSDTLKLINPLLETAEHINGDMWVAGNRVLISLNLFRNRITAVGVEAMLKAVMYQTILTSENKNCGTGLLKLNLEKNNVSPDHLLMGQLDEVMKPKNPFHVPPEVESLPAPDCAIVINSSLKSIPDGTK